jgi:hypothetical protein
MLSNLSRLISSLCPKGYVLHLRDQLNIDKIWGHVPVIGCEILFFTLEEEICLKIFEKYNTKENICT